MDESFDVLEAKIREQGGQGNVTVVIPDDVKVTWVVLARLDAKGSSNRDSILRLNLFALLIAGKELLV